MEDGAGSSMWRGAMVMAAVAMACVGGAGAQGFPNINRTPGELIAGPIAPEQGRTAIVAWHGERIVSVPEPPGSQPGADLRLRVVDITDLDGAGPQVTILPGSSGGFLSHGYFQSGDRLFISGFCVTDVLGVCLGGPLDSFWDSLRIGGPGLSIGGSSLRVSNMEDSGLLVGTYDRLGAQSPWGVNSYWTYGAIGGDMWLAVRRNNEWVYDWGNGGAVTGPAVKARWDHLGLTGVTGFPFIMGNILIVASDQAGTGVASYDISDITNPVLLDVLKESNPGGYWPQVYGHYIFFPRRDGEGGVGSQAGYMIVDFEDPTDLKVVANRNVPGSNQYVTFQDEYAFMNNYKVDMRTFDVAVELQTVEDVIDASQFSLPVGNLVITGGYGLDGPGLAVFAHQAEPDTRGPYVAYHMPRPDQTNFSVDCPITLSIPETLKTETIVNGTSLILRPVGGSAIPIWHAFSEGKLLTVTPQQPMQPNTTYELLLTDAIEDAAGNAMEPYSFRFSTGSNLSGGNRPPQVTQLTVTPEVPQPGTLVSLSWTANDLDGDDMEYRIDMGDGTPLSDWGIVTNTTHTYTETGHYQLTVQVRDEHGSVSAFSRVLTVAAPPAQPNSTASSMVALDAAANRTYAVNPDNDTVTAVDTAAGTKLWESPVGAHPVSIARGNDGSLWVACRDSDELHILSPAGAGIAVIPLDYGARPVAIARTPDGASMLVSLEGDGALLRFNVASRAQSGSVTLGPSPRAIAVTHDGSRALVTRFVSGEHEGSVYDVALGGGMGLTRTIRLARDHSVDGSASGRGVPNYLAGIRISPDGAHAWVVGKKDNTTRGIFNSPLMVPGQDSTLRAMLMLIDLAANEEDLDHRLDIDNSDSPTAVAFSPLGDYAFITLQGNNVVGVVDVLEMFEESSAGTLQARWATGLAPQAIEVNPATRQVVVNNFMGRSLTLLDAEGFMLAGALDVPAQTISTVAQERLHPRVLQGKQVFYNASDIRMSAEGYISCATCHVDGAHDGRTWDFTNRGEGFRNTTDLRGRSGMAHGAVHWTANFDEIQDFENDIRGFFGGSGFLSTSDFALTTNPLGTAKAGRDADLDALAAYVSSLGTASIPRNPTRDADGDMTAAAVRGQAVFQAQGCAACHVPSAGFTDRQMHDVGTLRASSGGRIGGVLSAIDTPTLLGLHATAPYFHNGSAATLEEVFTTTGGRLAQAEDGTLAGGAYAEDIPWFPMKEWHGGEFVVVEDGQTITFNNVASSIAGAGYIEVRYSVRYALSELRVTVNGGGTTVVQLAMTPNVPSFVPSEWRTVRVPITYQSGMNTIVLGKSLWGQLAIDDVLFSTPQDAQRASAHVRNISAGDLADLVAYVDALDGSNAGAPNAAVSRGAAITVGGTDNVTLPSGATQQTMTYTIANNGDAILDLGAFNLSPTGDDIWEILQQPQPMVEPGESTTIQVRVTMTGTTATTALTAWSNDGTLTWNINATGDGGEEPCIGQCLTITANGPTYIRREVGEGVTFSITATGDGTLQYQWYRETNAKALEEIDGANGPSLTLSNLTLADTGSYYCIVEDANETEQSPVFELEVVTALPVSSVWLLIILFIMLATAGLRPPLPLSESEGGRNRAQGPNGARDEK